MMIDFINREEYRPAIRFDHFRTLHTLIKERYTMLGIEGTGVILAYAGSVVAAAVCVIYGIINWNRPATREEKREIEEELKWERSDPENEEAK
jgi:hypothetical protein